MSTGGVAFVLSVIPSRFDGLTKLGTGIFVFNLFLFTAFTITMCVRFYVHPGTFTHSMTNPHEGFFFATFWLSPNTQAFINPSYCYSDAQYPFYVTVVLHWLSPCSRFHPDSALSGHLSIRLQSMYEIRHTMPGRSATWCIEKSIACLIKDTARIYAGPCPRSRKCRCQIRVLGITYLDIGLGAIRSPNWVISLYL